ARFLRKTIPYVVCYDFGAYRGEIIREAPASHRIADVERGPAAGHRVDDEGAGGGVIVQGVCDDRGRDRARVRDAEGTVVPEWPDVVGSRSKPGAEAVAPPQVFISRVDRLGSRVQGRQAAEGTRVARPGDPPEGAGLS